MSYVYEGLATVAVIARHFGLAPIELTSLDCSVRVSDAGPGRTRIELEHYLQGPKDANLLRVILPDGRMVQGPIIDGRNEPVGGWLLIDVEPYELPLPRPASITGWKWE